MAQIIRQIKRRNPKIGFFSLILILVIFTISWSRAQWLLFWVKDKLAKTSSIANAQGCWTAPSGGSCFSCAASCVISGCAGCGCGCGCGGCGCI